MCSRFLAGVLAAGAVVLVACGGGGSKAYNDTDVQFAQGMIPHHRQAIEMADLALTDAETPAVKDLAMRIKEAQDPEIARMTGWLRDWGKPLPNGDAEGMEHGSGQASTGTMTAAEMAQLRDV